MSSIIIKNNTTQTEFKVPVEGIAGEGINGLTDAQYSAVTGYFGTPVYINSNYPTLTKFALHVDMSDELWPILLPDNPTEGDTYRFLLNTEPTLGAAAAWNLSSNSANIYDGSAMVSAWVVPIAADTDYIELTYATNKWLLHSQNFLNYMAGLLPVSKVDAGTSPQFTLNTKINVDVTTSPVLFSSLFPEYKINSATYVLTNALLATNVSIQCAAPSTQVIFKIVNSNAYPITLVSTFNDGTPKAIEDGALIDGALTKVLPPYSYTIFAEFNGAINSIASNIPELVGAQRQKIHTVNCSQYGLDITLDPHPSSVNGVFATFADYYLITPNVGAYYQINDGLGNCTGWFYQILNMTAGVAGTTDANAIWIPYSGTGAKITDASYLVGSNQETTLLITGQPPLLPTSPWGSKKIPGGFVKLNMSNLPDVYPVGSSVKIIALNNLTLINAASHDSNATFSYSDFSLGNNIVYLARAENTEFVNTPDGWAIGDPTYFGGDGVSIWGNPPIADSTGVKRRYSLSQAQYIELDSQIGHVKPYSVEDQSETISGISVLGNPLMNQTCIQTVRHSSDNGFPFILNNDFVTGARVRFVDAADDRMLIVLPPGHNISYPINTPLPTSDYSGNGICVNTTTGLIYVQTENNDSTYTIGDTVEFQYAVNSQWRVQFFDFASWVDGALYWTKINFDSSAIQSFGEAYIDDGSTTATTTTTHVAVPVTSGLTVGSCRNFTFQNNSELRCDRGGIYHATWSMSLRSNVGDNTIEGKLMVNAAAMDNTGNATRAKENGVDYSVSGNGILTLALNDIVRLAVETEMIAATTITINHATLTLVQII